DRDRLRGSRRRPTKSGVITQDWYNTDGGSLVVRAHDHGDLTSCVRTSSAGSPCLAHITVRFSGMAWPPSLGVWTKNRDSREPGRVGCSHKAQAYRARESSSKRSQGDTVSFPCRTRRRKRSDEPQFRE